MVTERPKKLKPGASNRHHGPSLTGRSPHLSVFDGDIIDPPGAYENLCQATTITVDNRLSNNDNNQTTNKQVGGNPQNRESQQHEGEGLNLEKKP